MIDANDAAVVRIVAEALSSDIQAITAVQPEIVVDKAALKHKEAIILGTIGHSQYVDDLLEAKKLNVASIRGQWERFMITEVSNPMAGIDKALVVVGSDRRGTAFGTFELSRMLGVSPWIWWADVKPEPRTELYLPKTDYTSKAPSVKYRGIFLNDEDWGLHPWAAINMDRDIQDIGPTTHAKIFELMLRLRANIIWPAMHDSTKPFWMYPENAKVADTYGIVIGSTHCDMMHRSNTYEWQVNFEKQYGVPPNEYRYDNNRKQVHRYWEDRVKDASRFENMYTIGMRGVRDGSMNGPTTTKDKIALLDTVISDQRQMIKRYHGNADAVPQLFIPYKEVLTLYNAGMQVPDDVTLVWTDDNYGYLRRLSTPLEQARKGGSGIYYHLSYMGKPHDYLWLSSNSPALISYEMTKAHQYGADQFWIVNVGDIKPGELEVEFFLDLAWNVERWNPTKVHDYTKDWASRHFGADVAQEIAALKNEYYRLTQQAKPEHSRLLIFNKASRQERLDAFQRLAGKADSLAFLLPDHLQTAYFELITYPIKAASLMTQKIYYAEMSFEVPVQYGVARTYSQQAKNAYEDIKALTGKYNSLENGKWLGMITDVPRDIAVYGMPPVAVPDVLDKPIRDLDSYDRRYSDTTKVITNVEAGIYTRKAEDFLRKTDMKGDSLRIMQDLGLDGNSLSRYPFTGVSYSKNDYKKAPSATYSFDLDQGGYQLSLKTLPTRAIHKGRALQLAVSIDGKEPQFVDFHNGREDKVWSADILKGYSEHTLPLSIENNGARTITLYFLDTGLALNRMDITDKK